MISFYHAYIAFQLAAMGLCIYTVYKITQARPSRAQVGSILFALASVIYVLGFLRSFAALHCQKSFTGLSRHFRCSPCTCCLPRKSWMLCALYGIR